jgi:hypothetical protein
LKTINLKTNSWHYFLAVKMGDFRPSSGDFCSYVRNVIGGSFLTLFLATAASALGSALLAGVANIGLLIYHWLTGTAYTPNGFLVFGTVILLTVTLVSALLFFSVWFKDWREERQLVNQAINKPDSFLKSAYKSFKDKVCFKVNFDKE